MIGEPVGREREIAIVDAFLARPDATLRALVLVGEPGIGKSTLWHRAVETGRERGLSVLASRPAEPERELANVVLGDLLVGVPASAIETLPGARRRAIEAALLTGDRASAPEDPRALGVAVATVVGSMADDAGLVIAIDDDQWMDAASAESLAFALRRLGDRPIRLLLARRTHDEPVVALEGAMDSAAVERLEVRPLSLGATQLLIRERLGVSLSRPALRELHRVSGGNPFHALELARERSRAPARDLELPLAAATVDALVRARLGALDGDVIAAARLVAANGRAQMALLDALG